MRGYGGRWALRARWHRLRLASSHRLNSLSAVVIAEQDHSFDGIIGAGGWQHPVWPRSAKKCLTGFDRQFSFRGIGQCLKFRQRIAAGQFKQAHHQRRTLDLAQQIDEMLHSGQDGRAIILTVARAPASVTTSG